MKPTWESPCGSVNLYLGDCLEVLPHVKADVLLVDPPYGCGKADWDATFPTSWYALAKLAAPIVGIITGSAGLKDTIPLVGEDFVDVISARNMNGMTRGPIGYGNWLACVVACGKPRRGQNAFHFSVRGSKADHPSPKPIEYMEKLVARLSEPGQTVCDPMMGSGTTIEAAIRLGRKAIGVEISPVYFALCVARAQRALAERAALLPFEEGEKISTCTCA